MRPTSTQSNLHSANLIDEKLCPSGLTYLPTSLFALTNRAALCVILVSIAVAYFPDFTHATNVSYQLHMLSFRLNPSANKVPVSYVD
ncbi:hypothetical protein [Vibrio sp. 1CM24A]|uniref:hypothetical protein n=1 Tax=Vibrio sp. 1CM24A TaxID=2929165 RepID=UPI0020BE28DA|nr:hypothetical protein [Vibrio sp. 1CM24A]MCK8079524.1 hypothetical protein [Vibrio sp. 1CM24A]